MQREEERVKKAEEDAEWGEDLVADEKGGTEVDATGAKNEDNEDKGSAKDKEKVEGSPGPVKSISRKGSVRRRPKEAFDDDTTSDEEEGEDKTGASHAHSAAADGPKGGARRKDPLDSSDSEDERHAKGKGKA